MRMIKSRMDLVNRVEGFPIKPDPASLHHLMRELGAVAEESLYIGDSDVDIRTAENAGIDSAWVSWGFRRRNELAGANPMHEFNDVKALEAFLLN